MLLTMAPADSGSLCIECGKDNNRALYKEFSGGTIQLSQCVSLVCGFGYARLGP